MLSVKRMKNRIENLKRSQGRNLRASLLMKKKKTEFLKKNWRKKRKNCENKYRRRKKR